jgi:hypothetical protein
MTTLSRGAAAILSLAFAGCALAQSKGGNAPDCGGADLCVSFEAADTRFDTPHQKSPSDNAYITTTTLGSLKWDVLNKANCSDPAVAACGERMRLVSPGRDGRSAIRLATLKLDNNVASSGPGMERNQIQLTPAETGAGEGVEQWWAHSLLIPGDSKLGDVHGWGMSLLSFWSPPGINFVMGVNQRGSPLRTFFRAWSSGEGGIDSIHTQYNYRTTAGLRDIGQCLLDDLQKDVWYDFVHRIKWSSTGQGSHTIWARKAGGPVRKVLERGPINTLYSGVNPLLKIGSYHDTLDIADRSTSAVHDRIRRGKSADAVRMADFPVDLDARVAYCAGTGP